MISSLFGFQSYRDLLKAVLEEEKMSFATPHKIISDVLGLTPSHLSMILDGKRNMSFSSLLKFAQKLKCTESEFQFLEVLFLRDNAKSVEEKEHYDERLKKYRNKNKVTQVRAAAMPKFSNWHILPLFVYITDFTKARTAEELFLQCRHLCPGLELSEDQLRSDIHSLQELGVLDFSNADKIHLRFDKLSGEFSQVKFMKSLVARTLASVPTHFSREDSHYSGEAVTLSKQQTHEFYQRYKALVSEFINLGDSNDTESRIVMIAIQMFPLEF